MVSLVNGLDVKASVRAATTGSETFTISGGAVTQITGTTVDGQSPAVGEDILVKNAPASTGTGTADSGAAGSSQSANGVYRVTNATTNLTVSRRSDADVSAEVTGGLTVWVNTGTTFADTQWTLISNDPITVNTTALQFSQTDRNALTFSGGLTKTANAVKRDDFTGDVTTTGNGVATTIANNAVTYAKFQTVAANSVVGNLTGSTANASAVSATSAKTASTVVTRDSNINTLANAFVDGAATTATAGGTTTLTVSSAPLQQFTGSTTQTVTLPDATTLAVGWMYRISNRSSGAVTVNANGGGAVGTVSAGATGLVTLIVASPAAGTWDFQLCIASAAGGLSSSNFVVRETPSGSVNGSNVTFTLANTPTGGTEEVYLNGLQQEPGAGNDYTISGATITYLTAPISGDKIRVSYMK
jgi:hypothetical protein